MLDLALAFLVAAPQHPPTRSLERRLAAYAALEADDLVTARALFEAELQRFPEHAATAYALACVDARSGATADALVRLGRAVELGFDDALFTGQDDDLATLRTEPRFAELLTTMANHPAPKPSEAQLVWTVDTEFPSYSSDGSRVVGGRGGRGSILDVRTGELVGCIPYDERGLSAVTVAPVGTRAAAMAFDHDVSVWDTFDGRMLWRRNVHGTWAGSPAWERSGASFLATGHTPDGDCVRLDAATGATLATFGHAPDGAWLSPDGKRVFTLRRAGDHESVGSLRDAATGTEIVHFDVAGMPMYQGSFSASGKLAWCLSAEAGEVRVFDAEDGRERAVLRGANGKLTSACGLPDRDELVCVDSGHELVWWDLESGSALRRVPLRSERFGMLDVSPDGRYLLSIVWGDALRVFDAHTGVELWKLNATSSSRWVFHGTFQAGGEELALPFDDGLTRFDVRTGRELGTLAAPSLAADVVALHPDGTRAVVACADGTLRTLELATGRTLARVEPRSSRIESCAWSSDGARALVAWADGTFGWLDGANGSVQLLVERALAVNWVDAFASDDGRRVVVRAAGGDALLYDGSNGAEIAKLGPAGWNTLQVIHSATRRVAAAQADGTIALFDLETGAREPRQFTTGDKVASVAVSVDGTALAAGTIDQGLFVWRVEDGALLRHHQVPDVFDESLDVRAIEFDADGKSVVFTTGDYGTVRRLDLSSGTERVLYDTSGGNAGTIHARRSVSGKRLYVHGMVTGDQPVLDAASGAPLLNLGDERVGFVDGTRDDRWVVGTTEHAVRVFGERLDARYTYIPFENGGWIVKAESLHCAGTAEALRWAVVVRGDETHPFASCASELLDPKRVRAAAAGVAVKRAVLGEPPTVRVVGPTIREFSRAAETVSLDLEFGSTHGIAAVEVDRNGVPDPMLSQLLTAIVAGPSTDRLGPCQVAWHPPTAEPSELRIVVYDRTGLGSRVARVRFVPTN